MCKQENEKQGKRVNGCKVISEIIHAEMKGYLTQEGMGEERDANKIRKMKIHSMNFSAFTYYILLVTGGVLKDQAADCFHYRNPVCP